MPIVFEEVTGEIVPERSPAQSEPAGESSRSGEDIADTVRHEVRLMAERDRRLRVD